MQRVMFVSALVLVAGVGNGYSSAASAEEFCNFDGCADFPDGVFAFADEVVSYSPA